MNKEAEVDLREMHLAKGEELLPEDFPELSNLSAGFIFKFVPRPLQAFPPEFVYIQIDTSRPRDDNKSLLKELIIAEWNAAWEAGHLRSEFVPQVMRRDFPKELKWLSEIQNANLYLIPDGRRRSKFDAFSPLYYLLPLDKLQRFGLPPLKRGLWPPWMHQHTLDSHNTSDFDERLARAFASHVWPLLNSGSRIQSFSKDDPIVLLAHNLNFWLPCVYKVAEERLRSFPRVKFDSKKEMVQLRKLRKRLPANIQADRPLCGGSIWYGEKEAWEATKELVNTADKHGQLRGIIDAVRANRVEDDFSNIWSYAKEDFERKLYHKRAKVRVSFVELDEAEPVHAPTSELHENLLWEDFLALLDVKERRIVVCLKNGITRVAEISQKLGYANHSPVSKALKRIREKAKRYLNS
jgi:hypothetical protein